MTTSKALLGLDPLRDLLGDVLARLEALEAKVGGVGATSAVTPTAVSTVKQGTSTRTEENVRWKIVDTHLLLPAR